MPASANPASAGPTPASRHGIRAEVTRDDQWLVGHPAIDREHRNFSAQLRSMQAASDGEMLARLDELATHLESHFGLEEALMTEHRFPASACHIEEHDKVRTSLHEVRKWVSDGHVAVAREFLLALEAWFPLHVQTMDAAVAQWTTRKTVGGSPIVWRSTPRTRVPD